MNVSRRDFLNLCKNSSIVLGLGALNVFKLEDLLANPDGPSILWLQGSACTGCSVSLLNRISASAPVDVADLLIYHVNLAYHNTAMAAAGETGLQALDAAYAKGNYILAIEGGVPTAFGGHCCIAWTRDGEDVTFQQAVTTLAARAIKILSIGTCAAWGGIAAAPPNPAGVRGVSSAIGKSTINIAGCPPHPDWIVWTISNLLLGTLGELDDKSRPQKLYSKPVHERCPRRDGSPATTYGQDRRCLKNMMCAGPKARADCPVSGWNNRANWCVDANSPCIGCTEPNFGRTTMRGIGESKLEA